MNSVLLIIDHPKLLLLNRIIIYPMNKASQYVPDH